MRNSSPITFWKWKYEIDLLWLNLNFTSGEKGSGRQGMEGEGRKSRMPLKKFYFLHDYILDRFKYSWVLPFENKARVTCYRTCGLPSLKMLFFHYQAFLVLAKLDVSIQAIYSFVCELMLEKNFSQSLGYIKGFEIATLLRVKNGVF